MWKVYEDTHAGMRCIRAAFLALGLAAPADLPAQDAGPAAGSVTDGRDTRSTTGAHDADPAAGAVTGGRDTRSTTGTHDAGPVAGAHDAGSVTGSVADAQGLALPGATVVLRTAGRVFVASAVTDRGGGFALAGVPAGDYLLAASLLGFAPREDPVTVGSAGADGVAVTLEVGSFSQEVRVTALMPEVATELAIPAAAIERRVARDLAQSQRGHAGVTALRRGAINLDPSVRGLYAEQIGVFVDGTRTFAAGPARMDSALSHVSPHALQSLRVVRGPYALTWGAGTLSAIQAETFKPAFGGDEFRLGGRAGYNYGSNGRASDGFASLFGSSGRVRFTFQPNTRTGSDHADGNGDVVEGDYESFDTRWDAGARLGGRTLLEYSGGHQKQNDVDYPGRILDATFFSTRSHACSTSSCAPSTTTSRSRRIRTCGSVCRSARSRCSATCRRTRPASPVSI